MADKDFQTVQHVCNIKISSLVEGVNILEAEKIIVFKKGDKLTACRNRCMHRGGTFAPCEDIEDSHVLKCLSHGWKLDCQNMKYVDPVGGIKQPTLVIDADPQKRDPYDLSDPDDVAILEVTPLAPWHGHPLSTPDPANPLAPGDFTVEYFSHASLLVRAGGAYIFMDPWLTGPAFTRGWWLVHKPPPDWLATLAAADVIYISHNHSDHLNEHTLKALHAVRPDIDIVVPAFSSFSCYSLVTNLGFTRVRRVAFGQWQPLGAQGARYMLLEDYSGRHDSAILVDYKGKAFLNTVDCNNPNYCILPKVDVLFSQYAGCASGYPVCWPELYPRDHIVRLVERNRKKMLELVIHQVKAARPSLFAPFAGYFTEAHPGDAEIRSLNVKNTPADFCRSLARLCPGLETWQPQPGGVVDLATLAVAMPGDPASLMTDADWQFDKFTSELAQAVVAAPALRTHEGLLTYFRWAGFCGADLLLHVLLVDDDDASFTTVLDAFAINFAPPLEGLRVEPLAASEFPFHAAKGGDGDKVAAPADEAPEGKPAAATKGGEPAPGGGGAAIRMVAHAYNPGGRYLRMRVRRHFFYHVAYHGLSWEELSIGFQCRFYREPDAYNFDFWNHFQNLLPADPPAW